MKKITDDSMFATPEREQEAPEVLTIEKKVEANGNHTPTHETPLIS